MKEMVEAKNNLCELGLDGWIHSHDKIISMDPICLEGRLEDIKKYI